MKTVSVICAKKTGFPFNFYIVGPEKNARLGGKFFNTVFINPDKYCFCCFKNSKKNSKVSPKLMTGFPADHFKEMKQI